MATEPSPDKAAPGRLKALLLLVRRLLEFWRSLGAWRWFLVGIGVCGVLLAALLVWLSVDAYYAAYEGRPPSPGGVVTSLLRDVAIVFVAFEMMIIGVLLLVLTVQVLSLVVLLRNEVVPMLEAANETLATVRGTTQFVSQNVVSPVVKWSGYLAGLRRILQQVGGLREDLEQDGE